MNKKYYELVIEGHYNAIFGLLEGFLLASKEKSWNFYFSNKYGIKTETFTEKLVDFITMRTKLHHIVINEDFWKEFEKAVRGCEKSKFVHIKYIKHAQLIKDASFKFTAKTYGRKYGEEIKTMVKGLPSELVLHDYNPMEKINEDAKGVEMYAPEHDYIFEATGRVSGQMDTLIKARKEMNDYPLIEVEDIVLEF